MPSMLVHMRIKPDKLGRFEEIIKALVRDTQAHEKECLRYEYWRGADAGQYYAFLAFPDLKTFYEHQGSAHHEQYIGELTEMFEAFRIEYVDPVEQGGSDLPRTDVAALPADAPAALRQQQERYPIDVQRWWTKP